METTNERIALPEAEENPNIWYCKCGKKTDAKRAAGWTNLMNLIKRLKKINDPMGKLKNVKTAAKLQKSLI